MTVFIDLEKPYAPSPFLRIGVDTAKQMSRQRKSLGMPQAKSVLAKYKTIKFFDNESPNNSSILNEKKDATKILGSLYPN